jgi:hypothetical protein
MYARQRERYPDNWEAMSLECKARAKWRCEQCGIAEGTWRIGLNKRYKESIQAAHLDHDPWNPNARLMAMCQPCHIRYDALEHGRTARQTKCRKQREAEMQAGQLELCCFDEREAMEA